MFQVHPKHQQFVLHSALDLEFRGELEVLVDLRVDQHHAVVLGLIKHICDGLQGGHGSAAMVDVEVQKNEHKNPP